MDFHNCSTCARVPPNLIVLDCAATGGRPERVRRAIAWAGVPVAIAMLAASLGTMVLTEPLAAGGLFTLVAFGLFVLWLLAISILLLATKRKPA